MNFWKQDFALLEAPVMETDRLDASTPEGSEGSEVCARSPLSQVTFRTGHPWSPVHMWDVTTALNYQLVQAAAGSHQVLTGRRSSHPPLLDPILTVAGGHSWCLVIIISHSVDLGGAKLPRPSQMDSMNAHKAKLRCQGGV